MEEKKKRASMREARGKRERKGEEAARGRSRGETTIHRQSESLSALTPITLAPKPIMWRTRIASFSRQEEAKATTIPSNRSGRGFQTFRFVSPVFWSLVAGSLSFSTLCAPELSEKGLLVSADDDADDDDEIDPSSALRVGTEGEGETSGTSREEDEEDGVEDGFEVDPWRGR